MKEPITLIFSLALIFVPPAFLCPWQHLKLCARMCVQRICHSELHDLKSQKLGQSEQNAPQVQFKCR